MPREDPAVLDELRVIEAELNTRWPESKIDPSLARIAALADILGQPQRSYPVLHVAGTNGKTSVVRMIDSLMSTIGLRTGRFTSPHLQSVTERISIDNAPIEAKRYIETYREIEPYLSIVDKSAEVPLSKFEVLTAMAYAAFADAPIEAGIVEVGLGGRLDSTNIADGQVATITPVGIDHVEYLGSDLAGIAAEKAGIIKEGATVILAEQEPEAARAILEKVAEMDATVARQGSEFGVLQRDVAIGGQRLLLQGLGGEYEEIFLPLHGAHQAANAALALATVEAFFGAGKTHRLDMDRVREGFENVRVPGRLERLRSAPTVLTDAAHNPHGAAALASAIESEFAFRKLVGVVGVLGDKDATGILTALEPVLSSIVLTTNSSPRALPAHELADRAEAIFGDERVEVVGRLDDAVERAVALTEDEADEQWSGAGVLVTGSVVTAGEARALFGKDPA
ncbi:bifunctional tetrahydrofolate synthase/dihydrofolate synthase [Sciscionella sediminilitoris]|uniref:bifunctional tetrahydrofolate synthase/dihydrofolate synthase n=1 Tax=Sciscionella sediminilitoris TaxID=1445613 RepID=UPI0004DF9F96|nr:folylpolyglutamate synthase/dihydrofolate synthase family protein [Sciscionella sp. SE31]